MVRIMWFTILALSLPAFAGPGASGGGNELVANFVVLANGILKFYPWPETQRTILTKALNTSAIEAPLILLTKKGGDPVPQQQTLVAWTQENYIQIKAESPGSQHASWGKLVREKRSIAHQIVHELYRASGLIGPDGKSIDDNYRLSIGQFHLDQFQLYEAMEAGPVDPAKIKALLEPGDILKPDGHLVYCRNPFSQMLFAELTEEYALVIRQVAFHGKTLPGLIDGVAPEFSAKSDGQYLQLSTRTVKTFPIAGTNPVLFGETFQFSPNTPSLIWGSLGKAPNGITFPIKLSDGVINGSLEDSSIEIITDRQITERVNTALRNDLVAHVTIYGPTHPFSAGGYQRTDRFDIRSCMAR